MTSDGGCYQNAVAFDGFCRDVEARKGKVAVALSSDEMAPEGGPFNDLVIKVSMPGAIVSKRVTGSMAEALVQLRDRLGLAVS